MQIKDIIEVRKKQRQMYWKDGIDNKNFVYIDSLISILKILISKIKKLFFNTNNLISVH